MSLVQRIADFTPQAAGATAVLTLPPGPTYDGIRINAAGATATLARLKNPRLEINGVPVLNLTGLTSAEIDNLNKFHGRNPAAAGPPVQLYIPFRRQEIKGGGPAAEIAAERLTALRTGNAGVVQLKFDVDAAYVDAPNNLTAEAEIAPGAPEAMGLMTFTRVLTYNLNAGFNAITNVPRVARIAAMHFLLNDITEVSIKRNRVPLVDRASKAGLQQLQNNDAREYNRVALADRTSVNFIANGNLDEAVSVAANDPQNPCTDLEVDLTSTAGGACNVVVEYIGRLGDF